MWQNDSFSVHSTIIYEVCIPLFSDLSKNSALKDIILESFNHSNEEVKSAASYALGNISLGNLQAYLPFVLHEIETKPKRQYLLLHSLKEVRYGIRHDTTCFIEFPRLLPPSREEPLQSALSRQIMAAHIESVLM